MKLREQYFTPAYYLFNWRSKLKNRLAEEKEKINTKEQETKTEPDKSDLPSSSMTKIVIGDEMVQLDIFGDL